MDEKTREALEGSIRKWQAIVDGTGEDRGADNCPLCEMFIDECDPDDDSSEDYECHGCPVKNKTGQSNCDGSPYYKWRDTLEVSYSLYVRKAVTEEQKSAAREELEFLKSLRPTEG